MSSQSSDLRMIHVREVPIGMELVIPKVNVPIEVAPTQDHVLRYKERFVNTCLEHIKILSFSIFTYFVNLLF